MCAKYNPATFNRSAMKYTFAIFGCYFLIAALPQKIEASDGAEAESRSKRSLDLNDALNMYHHGLPQKVVPTSYRLEVEPFVGEDQFKGRVWINVTWWAEMEDRITLTVHPQLHISVYSVRLTELPLADREKGIPLFDVNIARTELPRPESPRFIIHLEQMLKQGSSCEVMISFTGNLTTNETSSLFKAQYPAADGRTRSYVATYLRPDNAQRMFPCIDLPSHKATFKLSVLRPRNTIALSNTPVEETVPAPDQPDMVWDHFEETPQIATYQLALLVCDFESIKPTMEVDEIDGRRLNISVWARKEYLDSLVEVSNKIVRIVNYLQAYFNSSIGLPKLDIVALPMFNAAKASDSWGLMFFKESELNSPFVWNTAYELIYQWIGQYITPMYWSEAPINKELNSFLASMTAVDINPDEMEGKWPMTMLYSLYYEFGKTVPFSRVAGIRDEAMSAKTELIFRMFNYTMGQELFRAGVRNFIHSTSQEGQRTFFKRDVYASLDSVANEAKILPEGLSIQSIALLWTLRDRVPLVTAIRDYETKNIILSQKVYLREAPPASTAKLAYRWDIPILMLSESNMNFNRTIYWLTASHEPENMTIPDIAIEDDYIIVNPEEIGVYPVNYDPCNWKMLAQFLQGPNRETIPVLTRAKLLHDSWNLAYAGELCFGIALNMTLFLKEERNHVVWQPVFTMIDHIGRRIEGSDVYLKFEAYVRTLLKPLYLEVGETAQAGEPSWKTHMRGLVKNFLCRAGYERCVEEARYQYKKWLTDEEPDKGNPVANEFICPVFKWGTEEEWEFGLQRVINFPRNSPERKQNERTYLLKTLAGCPKDTAKIERLLNVTILDQNGNFTDSDIRLIFSMLTGSAAGYTTLFNFLADHWDTVKQRFEDKKHLWDGIINSATSSFNTQEGLDMVSELYDSHRGEFKSAENIIQEALKIIKKETEWSKKNLHVIDAWLTENLSPAELEMLKLQVPRNVTVAPISG